MTIWEFNERHPVHRVVPDTCWCGAPSRQAEDHICGECPEHCELAAHRDGRPSPRDVELRRLRQQRDSPGGLGASETLAA